MRRRSAGDSTGPTESVGEHVGLAVGTRVRTHPSSNTGTATNQHPRESGIIVDDFGEVLATHDHYGRDWALTKRWAIALDSGSLVFRNDIELEREP